MQDRMCGRCDCVLRAGKNAKKERWYKEPPSRYQGNITFTDLEDRGQGNPDAEVWVMGVAARWADRSTSEAKSLKEIYQEDDHHRAHEIECNGVVGLHPQIAIGGTMAEHWKTLLGVDAQGQPLTGRGSLWELWRSGGLFVTEAIKCHTSGPVPKKNLELFAENCRVHLRTQFEKRKPRLLLLAGAIAQTNFAAEFLDGASLKAHATVTAESLGGMAVYPLAHPEKRGGPKAWAKLDAALEELLAKVSG